MCVVGLDGVPYTLLKEFIADGTMPVMAQLAGGGALAQMKVTLPEISSVSWSSFMSGAGPGAHGIYGFYELKPNSYEMQFPTFADLQSDTVWDRIGKNGKSSVVLNQPSTYPAREIPGVLVSGFVAINLRKAVKPLRYLRDLEKIDYAIDVDIARGWEDHEYLMKDLNQTLDKRKKAANFFWKNVEWDYFQVVVTGTDRLQHFLWDAIRDEGHAFHTPVREYYRAVDEFIGEIYERFQKQFGDGEPDGSQFFLLSDHGFTGIKKEVFLNNWLRENGFLEYEKESPENLGDLASTTKAFALDPSRIYVHANGKYPKGQVEPNDVESIKADIKTGLAELDHEGARVLESVEDGKSLYSGPCADRAPDLVAVPNDGFDLKGSVKSKALFADSAMTGMHTWHDAFFWSREPVKDSLNITDIAGIIETAFE